MSVTIENKEQIRYSSFVEMETIICYKCAIPFAVPLQYKTHLKSSQEYFYCPNGHDQMYTKSTETLLREKMETQRLEHEQQLQALQNRVTWANQDRDNAKKQQSVLKGKITKITNRIKNGVCPCCNRTFHNLQQHMKTKHPEFKDTPD